VELAGQLALGRRAAYTGSRRTEVTFEEAKQILAALEREHVAYVLVGSMGMAAHGLVRATRDLDLFVDPCAENVKRLRSALRSLFDDPSVEEITSEDLLRPSSTRRQRADTRLTSWRGSARHSASRTWNASRRSSMEFRSPLRRRRCCTA
jgi:hypothetical protein